MITARQNIFELIEKNYNLGREISKINDLYEELYVNFVNRYGDDDNDKLSRWANNYGLPQWKNRGTIICIDELEEILGIEDIIDDAEERILSVEGALRYIEYILNIVYLYECKGGVLEDNDIYEKLMKIVNNLLGHVNYEIKYFQQHEKVLVVEKNSAATAVAEVTDKKTALNVIEYNHYLLKGNLEKKQTILKILADKAEGIRTKEKDALDDFMYLANNAHIRHNNKLGSKKQDYLDEIGDEGLEKLYDKAYQLFLSGMLDYEYKTNLKSELKEIKKLLPHK